MVAQRSSIPVKIEYGLSDRPGKHVETALYFVASEAITNAVKHANATVITIAITSNGRETEMHIRDDGAGGANPD
jgi:signal transduction histidine kinase